MRNTQRMMAATMLGAAACLAGSLACADTYDFTYTEAGGGVLSGELSGTLQGDGNTIAVSSIFNVTFNGGAGPALPLQGSASGVLAGGLPDPNAMFVSLNGSFMDIAALTDPSVSDGFLFANLPTIGESLATYGPSYGNSYETFDASAWQLSAAPVPEPATLGLSMVGLAATLLARRRRPR